MDQGNRPSDDSPDTAEEVEAALQEQLARYARAKEEEAEKRIRNILLDTKCVLVSTVEFGNPIRTQSRARYVG